MTVGSSRKTILCGALATALSGLLLGGTAGAAPAPVPSEAVVITNYAHSNYLIPDNGSGQPGTYLQVYYRADHPFKRTFTFEHVNGQADVYKWRMADSGACAESSGQTGTWVDVRTCTSNKNQWWEVRRVGGTSRWVLVPFLNEGVAVTGTFGDDNVAPLRELPSPRDATAAQQWFLAPQ
ncbi:hypothetical protein [Streptomyces tremellae]|uniref:Ricin B lectin domain-containing protein n=1 Tax=Streptomyces tremellae TaxID=1124239 RepID=A0ABP7FF87_9ACTN